ncbi:MAG: site-specific recombinase [Herminiimonas sp.]|nr:site-specific recombinase [Herminiimonas sp.]
MKITLLKMWAIWRRFRRGSNLPRHQHLQYAAQVEQLMRRANPFASWHERANWMIDVTQWIRRETRVSLLDEGAWERVKHQRTRFLLDWLDADRDVRRVVQATLHKTLREAVGPELFAGTGLPREPAFFSELVVRIVRKAFPLPPAHHDLSTLFTAMFPDPSDADWLLGLDHQTLTRLWRLCADEGIAYGYLQQVDEALLYLVTTIVAVGVSPAFRQRLEPKGPLQATPFMALRRELETYLQGAPDNDIALRSVRMLIAVCQAQTDRIYAHLDEHGVSVGLVYHLQRMRAQLARMSRLIDLRAAQNSDRGSSQAQALLVDLINAHHHRASVRGLMRRSFALLARKMVERNADHGEHYIARDRTEYRVMFQAACIGGFFTAFTALLKGLIAGAGLARFFEGLFASLNYSVSFITMTALGGVLATKQPAVTAPALASKMGELDTVDGLRSLMLEVAWLLRSQAAAVFGNLFAVIPTMAVICVAYFYAAGTPLMNPAKAHASLQSLSILGLTPVFAAFTGVLLWLASLAAGFADNWFALHRLREALTHHRRLVHAVGATRAARCGDWVENNLAGLVGNVSLGLLLGMTPVLAGFFGLPLDVRHVTLSTATLTESVVTLGWLAFAGREFWLAAAGIFLIGLLNVGVAFACALTLALRAREVPARIRRLVFRAVLRRFTASPHAFLFPERQATSAPATQPPKVDERDDTPQSGTR